MKHVYQLRNKTTGLFSPGSMTFLYRKEGKIWPTLGRLRQHLSYLIGSTSKGDQFANLEVVEYELVVRRVIPVSEAVSKETLLKILKK